MPSFFPEREQVYQNLLFRWYSSCTAGGSKNIPPAEPWRCHFENDPKTPTVFTFFETTTSTWQYVVTDLKTREAVIIDPVLDYDPASGKVSTQTADGLLSFIQSKGLRVTKILETHAHADHLTASQYLKKQLGGNVPIGIGSRITQVQQTFAPKYGFDDPALLDGAFDLYLKDDETISLGGYTGQVVHLPGHTPDHVGYVFGEAIFTGDSIFNPDVGTARADFPGGNASDLYNSMQRLLAYPSHYRLFAGHDYPPTTTRENQTCSSTIGEQRSLNIHCKEGTPPEQFIAWRKERDAKLGAPRLLHPSLQVNIRAGMLPPPDEKGRVWMKTPVSTST
ncbi:Metallo-hydrolase/oxidoreductase [Panus rudis PR-1116 ss-1]|nr:Metallo-hydrolase/oxidoreductase [Panus rudis PR-1116 ss-1]